MLSSLFLFFFKQTTAYELRFSDWSSDVCSSDLFDPATALCLKRVTTPDPAQPLTALCEPTRCPNACISARHRPAWERAAADVRAHLRERRISDLQRQALQRELDRLTAVIAGIDPPAP